MNVFSRHLNRKLDAIVGDKEALTAVLRLVLTALRLIVAFGALSVLGTFLFYLSSSANDRAVEKNVAAIIDARTEARYTTCLRDNQIRHDAGEAAARKAQDFIDAQKAYTGAGPSTGRLLEAERAYVDSQRQVTLDSYPLRDCSEAGIVAFYKNPPPAVDDECEPDGQGLCVPMTTTTTVTR